MGTRERRVRSNQSDRILTQLFQESGADPQELAIAAVGGFGRGELSPGSDLDIAIITAYAQIIPESIINAPKYGCVNIHGSLLPKYRGASCVQAAILNGDNKKIGRAHV